MSDPEESKALPVTYAHHGEVVFVLDTKLLWELQDEMCSAEFKFTQNLLPSSMLALSRATEITSNCVIT